MSEGMDDLNPAGDRVDCSRDNEEEVLSDESINNCIDSMDRARRMHLSLTTSSRSSNCHTGGKLFKAGRWYDR